MSHEDVRLRPSAAARRGDSRPRRPKVLGLITHIERLLLGNDLEEDE
jgi:hypothetical protein